MKKILLFLFGVLMISQMDAQILLSAIDDDPITGDVNFSRGGFLAGDFITKEGFVNAVDIVNNIQLGTNAGDFVFISEISQLSDSSYFSMVRNSLGDTLLVQLMNQNAQWFELPLPNGIGPNISTCVCFTFGIFSLGDKPGFYFGNYPSNSYEGKIYLFNEQSNSFEEKATIPLPVNGLLDHVSSPTDNQLFYTTAGNGIYIGDITFDVLGNMETHRVLDTRVYDNLRMMGTYFVEKDPGEDLIVGMNILDQTTFQFRKKIFRYNTNADTSVVGDSLKLTELAEVVDLHLMTIVPADTGYYLHKFVTGGQGIKFSGSSSFVTIPQGISFISSSFDQIDEIVFNTEVDRFVGASSNGFFFDNKLVLTESPTSFLKFIYLDGTQEFFNGALFLDFNLPPVIIPPIFYTYYADKDEDGYTAEADSIVDTIAVAPVGYVTFQSNQYDCNDLDFDINPGAVEILDNDIDENCDGVAEKSPVDTVGTAITNVLPEGDFKILNNNGSGVITIQTNNSDLYSIAIHNMWGQMILVQDFENEIKIDLSPYAVGVYHAVMTKDGAIFTIKLPKN